MLMIFSTKNFLKLCPSRVGLKNLKILQYIAIPRFWFLHSYIMSLLWVNTGLTIGFSVTSPPTPNIYCEVFKNVLSKVRSHSHYFQLILLCPRLYSESINNILFKTWIIDAEWSVIDGIRQLIYVDQYYYWCFIFSSYLFLIESSQSHPSYSKDSRITQCYFMTQCYVTFYHSNVMTNIKCYEHGRVMIFLSCTNVLFGDIYLKYCLESCNNWRVVLQIQQ